MVETLLIIFFVGGPWIGTLVYHLGLYRYNRKLRKFKECEHRDIYDV